MVNLKSRNEFFSLLSLNKLGVRVNVELGDCLSLLQIDIFEIGAVVGAEKTYFGTVGKINFSHKIVPLYLQ
jgi:hypothetical protein